MKRYVTAADLKFMMFIQQGVDNTKNTIELNYGRQSGHTTSIIDMFDPKLDLVVCPLSMYLFYEHMYPRNSIICISKNFYGCRRECRHLFVENYAHLNNLEYTRLEEILLRVDRDFCFKLG